MQLLSAQPDFIITDEDGILIGSSGGTSLLTGGTEGQAPIVQGDGSIAWGAAGASSLSELDDWDTDTLVVPGDLVVRQSGGVAGTDEVQIYHDGSNAYIDSQSGLIRINSTSNTELQINGSTNWTFKYNSLQASNSATRDYAILRAGGAGDLILGADQGDLILQPDGSAQGDIYLKQDTHLEGTLKVLQPGGVSGTDEVQIYHDGSNAYIDAQSGDLIVNSTLQTLNGSYNLCALQIGSTAGYGFSIWQSRIWVRSQSQNVWSIGTTTVSHRSTMQLVWGNSSSFPFAGDDIGIGRASTGRLKVTNASSGWGEIVSQGSLLNERSADPSDPAEGQSVMWQSDGTGSGDDGDIMMKITAGGVTKTATLVDFSAV